MLLKLKKYKFHQCKRPISIDNILVSNKISFDKKDFKNFFGYKFGYIFF